MSQRFAIKVQQDYDEPQTARPLCGQSRWATIRHGMKRMISRGLVVARGLVVVGFVGLVFEAWNFNRPPFDLSKLDGLTREMTQDEVRELLGTPSSVFGDTWA